MIHIKRFIDKVAYTESRQSKDLILPMADARGLRDELAKLLADLYLACSEKPETENDTVEVEIVGGKF